MSDAIERCVFNASRLPAECTLPRGHLGKCKSKADARIREMEAQVAELEYRLRGAGISVPAAKD